MPQLFVEMCSARPAWFSLSADERTAFLQPVNAAMEELRAEGTTIIGWGSNDAEAPNRAPYDFFAAFVFPDDAAALKYERLFRAAGWYEYFEQVNLLGELEPHAAVLAALVEL